MSVKITYFVHGTTTDNENHRSTGQLHGELSSRGIQQSKELKNQISLDDFDGVFCSDLQRAVDSAKYTFGGVKPIIQDKRLRECDYGDLNGADETLVVYEQHIYKSFPNGESMQEVEKRMRAFCAFLLKNYNGKHIAIVAHKAPQFAFQVITEKKSWEQVIDEDWRKRKAWQPGWEYVIEPFYNEPSPPKGNYAFIDGQNLHL
ncbi:MAG: histidine phosphatase family protein [Candidatus Peribacteria bacterium]|jgi:broad specificity phosphatase PhoE|nr:histidine phosphatase family protein [Candidatus Peribacteria bacterium]